MSDVVFDLVIVGGGILGTSWAAAALKRGRRVALVERYRDSAGGSVRNFGLIWPQIVPGWDWVPRALRTGEIYEALAQRTDIGFRKVGGLQTASTQRETDVLAEFSQRASAAGIRCEVVTADEAVSLQPLLRKDALRAALYFPANAVVEPRRLVQTWAQLLKAEHGLEHVAADTVIDVEEVEGLCWLRTSSGQVLRSERVLLTTGEEFQTLFPNDLARSGLERCRLHMFQTRPVAPRQGPAMAFSASLHHYRLMSGCAASAGLPPVPPALEHWGIHLLAKVATDGSLVLGDSHEPTTPDRAPEFDYSTEIETVLTRLAEENLQLGGVNIARRWLGYYARHASQPYIDLRISERIRVVTGLTCGMSAGPGLTEELSEAW